LPFDGGDGKHLFSVRPSGAAKRSRFGGKNYTTLFSPPGSMSGTCSKIERPEAAVTVQA
jgi:hypothetical protein